MAQVRTPDRADGRTEPITAATPFLPADDDFHTPPDDNPFWTETTWWSFNVPDRKLGGWLHAAFHTNRGTVTWRVYVWDPSGATPEQLPYCKVVSDVPVTDPTPDLRDITIPGGGFSVRMLRPLRDYRIEFNDAEADFAVRLTYQGVHEPRRFTPGEPPFMEHTHLDQLGHVTGELVLSGQSVPIDCYSIRDRSWAPRGGPPAPPREKTSGQTTDESTRVRHPGGPRWREIERERGRGRIQYIFGHAGADTGFLAFVRVADGNAEGFAPLNHGWLLRDGRFELLDKSASRMKNYRDPVTGWGSHMDVQLRDVTGRAMVAEGMAVSHICERGGGSTALMCWDIDGKVGWGEDQDIWHPKHFARMHAALAEQAPPAPQVSQVPQAPDHH
ncbi:DUF7065 domain-containing protein [Mycobacterium bourgelatii]|uniref:DUF7065 domain-containing protein n=1 Tax=Mycobacterium bourgelatii TaxID=1273442 RepID=A0A7I9YJ90_MYCBU|nr:hypothetical protein [Mycobacterium bourgelatii]GFG88755.1 hypothetical protein MBOU_07970 [Mycobacterium bourgelatii]